MTMPTATFASVAPPPDGLSLAFTRARHRRNSKAAVSALGGAVAIASALSMLAPPGQHLVQEPTQPASGDLLPGLIQQPRPLSTPTVVDTPVVRTRVQPVTTLIESTNRVAVTFATRKPAAAVQQGPCSRPGWVACVVVRTPAQGPTMRASFCPSDASITVDYAPPVEMPIPMSTSHTVEVGTHSCSGS
jgi:hypothetical protein